MSCFQIFPPTTNSLLGLQFSYAGMLVLSSAVTFPRRQLHPAVVRTPYASCDYSIISHVKVTSYPRLNGTSLAVPGVREHSKLIANAVESDHTSSTAHRGHWEVPDDGSDTESDEGDEEEVNKNFRSGWKEERGTSVTRNSVNQLSEIQYEEELVREVEQLLAPEELAVLQQNETPDLDKLSTAKWNPLHTFALAGQIKFMDKLLENGFDIDSADMDGQTALHKAILGKKEAVISHLLRKGANPLVRDMDGATPLHYAVQVGAMQTVKLLIKYKIDLNIADNDGWTPLHVAIQSRNRDIAKVLLVNGADKTRRSKDGNTAFDLSLCYGKDFKSYDLAKLLKLVPANR